MKKTTKNFFAEITYLRIERDMRFKTLAKKVGVSEYWLRKQLKENSEWMYNKCVKIFKNEVVK